MRLFQEQPIAVVFDFDKTLSPFYQQYVIFDKFGVDQKQFWALTHLRTRAHTHYLNNRVIVEHEYLNTMIDYARRGIFKGLNNAMLTELGAKIQCYPGVAEMLHLLKAEGAELYIVSGGIRSMLRGLPFANIIEEIYAADFADYTLDDNGKPSPCETIVSVATSVIPTDKTRILHEISKGCKHGNFDTNATLPQEQRRIPFKNMIYVGDGVSDIHAFETVRRDGGHAVAVYNPEEPQFDQAEMLRSNGWVDLIGVADYRPGTTVQDWLVQKVRRLKKRIVDEEAKQQEEKLDEVRRHAPRFIHAWDPKD